MQRQGWDGCGRSLVPVLLAGDPRAEPGHLWDECRSLLESQTCHQVVKPPRVSSPKPALVVIPWSLLVSPGVGGDSLALLRELLPL